LPFSVEHVLRGTRELARAARHSKHSLKSRVFLGGAALLLVPLLTGCGSSRNPGVTTSNPTRLTSTKQVCSEVSKMDRANDQKFPGYIPGNSTKIILANAQVHRWFYTEVDRLWMRSPAKVHISSAALSSWNALTSREVVLAKRQTVPGTLTQAKLIALIRQIEITQIQEEAVSVNC